MKLRPKYIIVFVFLLTCVVMIGHGRIIYDKTTDTHRFFWVETTRYGLQCALGYRGKVEFIRVPYYDNHGKIKMCWTKLLNEA